MYSNDANLFNISQLSDQNSYQSEPSSNSSRSEFYACKNLAYDENYMEFEDYSNQLRITSECNNSSSDLSVSNQVHFYSDSIREQSNKYSYKNDDTWGVRNNSFEISSNYLREWTENNNYSTKQPYILDMPFNCTRNDYQQYIQNEFLMIKNKRKRVLNRYQRQEATIREKRRMLKLNVAFEELRSVLPISVLTKDKLSRVDTLKMAMDYIDTMVKILESR